MELRRHADTAHRHAHAHPLARKLLIAVAAATTVVCGSTYLAPAASAAARPIVVNVRTYGAKGDGRHNDSSAIQRAIARAARRPGSTVYLPKGVYYAPRSISLASHVNLRGAGMSASWLKGHLDFGSRSVVRGLKIGTSGTSAVHNRSGANHTTFTHVRFRGGGSAFTPVVVLGGTRGSNESCSYITFEYSEVERNLGVETDPPSRNLNDISIFSSYIRGQTHVHNITFTHDHVGVSNGQGGWDIGSPRMALEVWPDFHGLTAAQTGQKPWYNIRVVSSVFEATDWSVLDFSDQVTCDAHHRFAHSATGVVVRGNKLHGAGHRWSDAMGRITLEGPCASSVTGNTIYSGGARGSAIQVRDWETRQVKIARNVLVKGYGRYTPSPYDP